jgi:hypothetical protein
MNHYAAILKARDRRELAHWRLICAKTAEDRAERLKEFDAASRAETEALEAERPYAH